MSLVRQQIESSTLYQAGRSIKETQQEFKLDKIVKLASNENPIGGSPKAIQAMIHSLSEIHRYPNPACYDLRKALADRFKVPVDNVITGHGSERILSVILRTCVLDDEEVLTSEATFCGFMGLVHLNGIKLKTVPLRDYRFDLEAIADAVTDKTKIIYLVNPNNPTGTIYTTEEFINFITKVPPNVLVIVDEAYFEFAQHDLSYPDSMQYRQDNVIILRTFSKAYGLAGIRIGYGFAHKHLISNLRKVQAPFETSSPAQAAGFAALADQEFLKAYVELNRRGLEFFYDLFDCLGIRYLKSHANFVMILRDSEQQVEKLNQKFLSHGVIVRPLKTFGIPNGIRVTTGLEEENQFFAKILKKAF